MRHYRAHYDVTVMELGCERHVLVYRCIIVANTGLVLYIYIYIYIYIYRDPFLEDDMFRERSYPIEHSCNFVILCLVLSLFLDSLLFFCFCYHISVNFVWSVVRHVKLDEKKIK